MILNAFCFQTYLFLLCEKSLLQKYEIFSFKTPSKYLLIKLFMNIWVGWKQISLSYSFVIVVGYLARIL